MDDVADQTNIRRGAELRRGAHDASLGLASQNEATETNFRYISDTHRYTAYWRCAVKRAIHLFAIAAVTAAFFSCDVLDSPAARTDAYFPLAIGNEWSYSVSAEFEEHADTAYQETWNVSSLDSGWYRIDRYIAEAERPPGYLRTDEGALVEGHPGYRDAITVLPTALHEGASWENGWGRFLTYYPRIRPAARRLVYRYEVVDASAHAAVPAGSFHGMLLVRVRETGWEGSSVQYRWYAPGVGLAKEELRSHDGEPLLTKELAAYRVQ